MSRSQNQKSDSLLRHSSVLCLKRAGKNEDERTGKAERRNADSLAGAQHTKLYPDLLQALKKKMFEISGFWAEETL